MRESTKQFLRGLPICAVFAGSAAVAALTYRAASDYSTYLLAVKYYSIGWFSACVLSFYCGLLVVPRSLGIIFSFAGVVAFAIVCALNPVDLQTMPMASRIIQTLPAWLFLFAWAFFTISAFRSEKKKVRLSSWLWLTIFMTLAGSWGAFHFAQGKLHDQRNTHIIQAREKTLKLVEQLEAYQQEKGAYPDTLADAAIPLDSSVLDYRDKRIKYFGHKSDFVLMFEDPLLSNQKAFSYDTTQGGWFPQDPEDALRDRPTHMFLGFLRK